MTTLFILSKDKVYKDIEAEILPKFKDNPGSEKFIWSLKTEKSVFAIERVSNI